MRTAALRLVLWPALLIVLLGGCGGELQTPGEALRILGSSLPQAYTGESYEAPVRAVGGLRPFEYRLQAGELPPGLELSSGVIRGTPVETGTWSFTVAVSDANLSQTFQEYSLRVSERPPPQLRLNLPATEIRSPTRVRVTVSGAFDLRAASVLLTWDAAELQLVPESLAPRNARVALFADAAEGRLQLDMAALGTAWEGELELASFALAPQQPVVPRVGLQALLLTDSGQSHYQQSGAAAAGPAAPTAEDTDDPAGPGEAEGNDGPDGEPDEPNGAEDAGELEEADGEDAEGEDSEGDPLDDPLDEPLDGPGSGQGDEQ